MRLILALLFAAPVMTLALWAREETRARSSRTGRAGPSPAARSERV